MIGDDIVTSISSVGPSRSGDQFHYQWAARQCLGLLEVGSNLKAVTIEGASLDEGIASTNVGDEVIDVGFYYGSEDVLNAKSISYVQLKHSSKQSNTPWTASGLKKTIEGFASRFNELEASLGLSVLKEKIRFVFLTNRPVKEDVLEALADIAVGVQAPRHKQIDQLLKGYAASAGSNSQAFFSQFFIEAGEPDLWEQRNLLTQDLSAYLSEADTEAALQLKELVTRRATDEGDKNRSIRLEDVLLALKVTEADFLPAPSLILEPEQMFLRAQQESILETLLAAQHPVIIHADGGVGKSVLSACLAHAMPSGSVAVLYDCFGNGTYRQSLHYRHRYRDALVQIANELAGQQLCLPLIPSSNTDPKQFMRAFINRLKQAIDILKANTPQANLCIIIDAADNAVMAAQEIGERAFISDLINTDMPDGVRLVFTCRSHRKGYLEAPPDAVLIKLEPFSTAETAEHLRQNYPEATDEDVEEFAFLSSANPRVQTMAMEGVPPIEDMLRALGPEPTTVQHAIGKLLTKAIQRLKNEWGSTEANQIDLICKGLAVLRPLVPISILAQIAGVSESAVRTFATEFGRPLFIKGSSLHFMDEPTETWFRETFKPDVASLDAFLTALKPLAETSTYAAAALPQLLLSAGQINELVELALSNESLPELNPLERRDIELQRMIFALRASLQQGHHVAAAKLAIKLGGEVAGETRQNTLIQQNTDIASLLLTPDRIEDLVSRRTFGDGVYGMRHAYEAVLLMGSEEFIPEARSRLRMAWGALTAWCNLLPERREATPIGDAEIVELAIATLKLRGPAEAARFLEAWQPKITVLNTTSLVAARLVETGNFQAIDALAEHANGDVWMMLGLATEVVKVGHLLPIKPLRNLIDSLVDPEVELSEQEFSWKPSSNVLDGVRSAITLALRCLPRDDAVWAATLRRYLPIDPPRQPYMLDAGYINIIRAYALEAALRGERIELIDLASKDIRPELEGKGSSHKGRDASQLQHMTGGVLAWFVLAAEIACKRSPADLEHEIQLALKQTKSATSRDYQQRLNLDDVAAIEWIQILRDTSAFQPTQTTALLNWVDKSDRIFTNTLTTMCRIAARSEGLADLSLQLSSKAFEQLIASNGDAEQKLDELQDLARAVFCASKSEAAAYFDKAIEIASKIGEEHLSRWTAFLELAEVSHYQDKVRPRTAYRLSRIAELSYEHMARDKYMDWSRLVQGLVGLCPSSSLAILSRWRDREFGFSGELLPVAIYSLIDRKLLPKKAAVALAGIVAKWNRVDDVKAAIKAEPNNERKRLILHIAYRFLRVQPHETSTWSELKTLASSLAVVLPDLDRLLQTSRTQEAKEEEAKEKEVVRPMPWVDPHQHDEEPEWDAIFSEIDLCNTDALVAARRSLKNIDGRSYAHEFYKQGCQHARLTEISGYLSAIRSDEEFSVFGFLDVLKHLPEPSKKLQSVKNEIRETVLLLAKKEPTRFGRSYWGYRDPFDELYAESIVLQKDVASARIKGYLAKIDELGASDFFRLVEPLALYLTSEEADEVLNFGFDLLEESLEDSDGDGPWDDSLLPPLSCEEALAGYLWAGLARPSTAERWEHAHCIRNCLELNWQLLLSALASRACCLDPQPFIDRGLVFYEWHARQWLCIALAGGAIKEPRAVAFFLAFLESAVKEQHLVIRHFASAALKCLNEINAVPSELLSILKNINQPALAVEVYRPGEREIVDDDFSGSETKGGKRYLFGIDIGPYWLAPLGRVFGLSQQSIERRTLAVLQENLSLEDAHRVDDQRHKRGLFRDQETWHSHGSMPAVDDCLAYKAYHGMMLVASQLLETKPIRRCANESENLFDSWLEGYLLARKDGEWLADRRDPEILKTTPVASYQSDELWCWQVDKQHLDDQLTTDDDMTLLWGDWTTTDTFDGERISVQSVLVPTHHAEAFVSAMQTSPNLGEIYFPDADHSSDEESEGLEFNMHGWVRAQSDVSGLDERDSWAGKINSLGPRPSQEIIDVLNLTASPDENIWTLPNGAKLRSEIWSRSIGYGENRDCLIGHRLSANSEFISALLDAYPDRSLVIRVHIRRALPKSKTKEHDYSLYNYPYHRYYLIGYDGIIRTL